MTEIKQQLESLEEVIQQLVHKLSAFEKGKGDPTPIRFPDYSPHFKRLHEELAKQQLRQDYLQVQHQLNQVEKIYRTIPGAVKIKHQHLLDLKSRGVIVSLFFAYGITALLIAVSVSLWERNSELSANSWKYRIMRQLYPKEALRIDRLYNEDVQGIRDSVMRMEQHQQQVHDAEIIAMREEEQAKEARKKADRLKEKKERSSH